VPLSPAAKAAVASDASALATVLTGGDDYEILATVPPGAAAEYIADARAAGVPVTDIGEIVRGSGPPVVLGADGKPLKLASAGHTHF
jgi:thiamine-monophosphate kinase